jgi:hypothetical protein
MAYEIRKTNDTLTHALVAAHNLRQEESVASFFHADTTQKTSGQFENPVVTDDLVTAADGSSEATNITLVNEIKAVLNRHFADTFAHDSAVSAAVATADADDEATSVTLANALKAAYNTHLTASNVHFNNDGDNAVAAADATDTASVSTLINEMKDDLNAHIVDAPAGAMIRVIPA